MAEEQLPAAINRKHATQIVAAYVRRHQIAPELLPAFISSVHGALAQLGKQPTVAVIERTPAVPIKRSVTRDFVICLDCGWRGQMLKRHLMVSHGLSVDAYRERWNLARDHVITAPAYSERRSGLAKHLGLGRRGAATARSPTPPQPVSKKRGRDRAPATESA
jgi:MucR family transcriptional regulator, transcriptional regulator of exopolysaccharide biosynthesis